jgi:hypothetical protein
MRATASSREASRPVMDKILSDNPRRFYGL